MRTPSRIGLRSTVAPLVGLLLSSVAFTWPLVPRAASSLAGGPGDNMVFYWGIWWFREALFHLHRSPFHTPLLHHPTGADLAYHTTTLLNTVPGAVLGLVLPLPVVYNGLILANFFLAAVCTYGLGLRVLHRAHGARRPADTWYAAFAAIAYSFAPFHMAHLGHLNILSVWVLPCAAWTTLRAHENPSARNMALLGVTLGLCGLADGYHLVSALVLVSTLWILLRLRGGSVIAAGASRRASAPAARVSKPPWPGPVAVAAGVGSMVLLLLPLIVPALEYGASGLEDVRAGGSNDFVADLLSYLLPSPQHFLWGRSMQNLYAPLTGNLAEQIVFPTATVWILALLAWRSGSREARLWGLVALVFVVLSFGPYLHIGGHSGIPFESARRAAIRLPLPKLVLDQLPLASGARAASRFAAVGQLALALSAMIGLARHSGRRGALVALGCAGFECLTVPLAMTPIEIPPAYTVLRDAVSGGAARPTRAPTSAVLQPTRRGGDAQPGVLLEIPPVHTGDKVYQLYQTVHGLPIVGGRVARGPRAALEHLHRDPLLERLYDRDPLGLTDGLLALDGLDSLGVTYVMIHDRFDLRSAAIARLLERRFDVVPTPPGLERLLRRRSAQFNEKETP